MFIQPSRKYVNHIAGLGRYMEACLEDAERFPDRAEQYRADLLATIQKCRQRLDALEAVLSPPKPPTKKAKRGAAAA